MSLIRQPFSAIWKWLQKPACWCSSPFRLFHCYRCNYSIILPVSKFGISFSFFFSIRVFFHRHWRFTGQEGKRGDHLLFHSATFTRSRIFRHLFATFYVRWLSRIFNHTGFIYQTATRWDLSAYWITTLLMDDAMLIFLFVYLIIWF